jgi:coproporphyrinogen III oxidase-like Fe-S oxidoreductase
VPRNKEELNAFYRHVIPWQIEQYKPVLENVKFHQAYFGGGTPTIVEADILAGVYNQIPHFKDIPLKTTEISPFTVTHQHLDLFGASGFAYVSMGVQTLNRRVLGRENRLWVSPEKIKNICQQLEEYNIISNIDLIFFLDTGELVDLDITRNDLDIMMSDIRPVSMTLHSNYRHPPSIEKRAAMISFINEMLGKYPEYRCVNSMLQKGDIEFDSENSAEYRIMRKQEDFNFYMLPKVPKTYPYGHNILSFGEYEEVKPWSNYYYIYTLRDKYLWKQFYKQSRAIGQDFETTRETLSLPHHHFLQNHGFFSDETGKERFKVILRQAGIPYHDF